MSMSSAISGIEPSGLPPPYMSIWLSDCSSVISALSGVFPVGESWLVSPASPSFFVTGLSGSSAASPPIYSSPLWVRLIRGASVSLITELIVLCFRMDSARRRIFRICHLLGSHMHQYLRRHLPITHLFSKIRIVWISEIVLDRSCFFPYTLG